VPGVVLLDHVLEFARSGASRQGDTWRIPSAKFLKPLLPGQEVMLGLEGGAQGEIRFTCRIGAVPVAEGVLVPGRIADHE
jgi:3-hydroxyacyl-[acyl-carrier-protein] dehydratase